MLFPTTQVVRVSFCEIATGGTHAFGLRREHVGQASQGIRSSGSNGGRSRGFERNFKEKCGPHGLAGRALCKRNSTSRQAVTLPAEDPAPGIPR